MMEKTKSIPWWEGWKIRFLTKDYGRWVERGRHSHEWQLLVSVIEMGHNVPYHTPRLANPIRNFHCTFQVYSYHYGIMIIIALTILKFMKITFYFHILNCSLGIQFKLPFPPFCWYFSDVMFVIVLNNYDSWDFCFNEIFKYLKFSLSI